MDQNYACVLAHFSVPLFVSTMQALHFLQHVKQSEAKVDLAFG